MSEPPSDGARDEPLADELGKGRLPYGRVLALLSGLGAFLWLVVDAPAPAHRVVVSVEGCSAACQQSVALSLSFLLETQGFEVATREGEAAGPAAQAMREKNASHVLRLRVGEAQTVGASVIVEAALQVESAGSVSSEWRTEIAVDGPADDESTLRAGLLAVDTLFPRAAHALLRSDAIRAFLDSEPRGSTTAAAVRATLARAARAANRREDEMRRYELHCEETLDDEGCVTPTCAEEHLVALTPAGWVVQVEGRPPVFPIDRAQHVRASPAPERLVLRSEGESRTLARARDLWSYGSYEDAFAYVEAGAEGFVIDYVAGEERKALYEATRPRRIRAPLLRGDFVLFEELPFRGGDSTLRAVPVAGGDAIDVALYGHQGSWVALRDGERRADFVAVRIAGIRPDALRALEAQEGAAALQDGGLTQRDEAEAVDDIDELDLDELSRQRLAAGFPPRDHLAIVELRVGHAPRVRMRFGGRSYSLFFAAANDGRLVLVRATREGCEAAQIEAPLVAPVGEAREGEYPESAIAWTRLSLCPEFPTVAAGRLFGTSRVRGEGELFPDEAATDSSEAEAAPSEGGPEERDATPASEQGDAPASEQGDATPASEQGDAPATERGDAASDDASAAVPEERVEHPGLDREVVMVPLDGGPFEVLTSNTQDERFVRVRPGADGVRVAFERRSPPRYAGFRPSRVCEVQVSPLDDAP